MRVWFGDESGVAQRGGGLGSVWEAYILVQVSFSAGFFFSAKQIKGGNGVQRILAAASGEDEYMGSCSILLMSIKVWPAGKWENWTNRAEQCRCISGVDKSSIADWGQ